MTDPINVSALNQYAYCPRRCGLIYLEGEFEDNVHTSRGSAEHDRVDRVAHATTRDGARLEYALPIWSERLGLIGKCDVVEFWPDGTVYPVEYKHGPRRTWLNDDIQLGAQAMCLEEMLNVTIPHAAIFHAGSKRRREVEIAAQLRTEVQRTVSAIRGMLADSRLPAPTTEVRRCRECSLKDICQPEAVVALRDRARLKRELFEPGD
ncbi:MAG: CRISPR-associated protein Cas4 [Gammaproteobacteria bacterium]